MTADGAEVERRLVAYYDQEVEYRAARVLEDERIQARDEFLASLPSPDGARLLEVGTGPGRDAAAFVAHGFATYGIDLSLPPAKLAAGHGVRQAVASVRGLPFRDESFDVVWSMSVLMHVPDTHITGALSEVQRVLRAGGLAVIGVWGGPDVEATSTADRYDPPRLFSRRSDTRWRAMLDTIGEIEDFQSLTPQENGWWYQYARIRRGPSLVG